MRLQQSLQMSRLRYLTVICGKIIDIIVEADVAFDTECRNGFIWLGGMMDIISSSHEIRSF